jgi:transposase
MSRAFTPWDVDQAVLFPATAADYVPEDHPVHYVRQLVAEELDLAAIWASYRDGAGAPAYHPAMMTALLLYGYSLGIRSSRKLASACLERMDFFALTGGERPNFRTISKFRQRHLPALGGLFVEILKICRAAGLAKLGHVALDGTKMAANASKHKAMSYERMSQEERRLAEEVAGWLEEAEAVDAEEDGRYGEDDGRDVPPWMKKKSERLAKIREAKAALEREAKERAQAERERQATRPESKSGRQPKPPSEEPAPKAQRNFTDPDSRVMRDKGTYTQAYNCQAAVDADNQIIVAADVTQQQNDGHMLDPLLSQVKRNCGRQAREVSADAGYCSEENLALLRKRHIRAYVATGRQKHGAASATGSAQKPRPLRAAMATRLKRGAHRSRYRLRKYTVEPVFGQIKEARGIRRFLLRGFEKVQCEWQLICATHNLGKLMRAIG